LELKHRETRLLIKTKLLNGYIRKTQDLVLFTETGLLRRESLGFRVFVKPCALFCIPLWVLPLIINAQRWFLVEL
jgi:hypothetical protein